MHIENQVCTLDQARTLMELGIDQNIVNFYWMAPNSKDAFELIYNTGGYEWNDRPGYNGWPYRKAAYTTAELGKMIDGAFITALSLLGKWEAWTNPNNTNLSDDDYELHIHGSYDTEAECRAGNLIDFINNGILSVAKINERLSGGL